MDQQRDAGQLRIECLAASTCTFRTGPHRSARHHRRDRFRANIVVSSCDNTETLDALAR